jgi:folate-binding protein YgfZ
MPVEDEYTAIREGAALVIPADRGRIGVSGRDRAAFLHGLLTNDIQALTAGTGCYAAWLTAQGRMTTDMHVLEAGDMILLDVPAATRESVLQRLDQFLFSEDVRLGDLTGTLAAVALHGPRAAATLERTIGLAGLAGWPQYRNARADVAGESAVIARIDQFGVPGFVIYVSTDRKDDLAATLDRNGARRVTNEALEVARVETGYPLFGVDMNDDIIPLEAGIEDRAISLTKGCYVGQEVIIRVLHRGHGRIVRRLVGLRSSLGSSSTSTSTSPMRAGGRVHAGGRDVGFVTSVAHSPRFGLIGLGYVHREFFAAGTGVEIEADGDRVAAVVSSLPFA